MKQFFLSTVRLTYYYPILFLIFLALHLVVDKQQMSGGQLTLFSVNSFLLAFYLGPILAGQKQRIDDIAKTLRLEAITFFNIAVQSQALSVKVKHQVKAMTRKYLLASVHTQKPAEGEAEYEALMRFCIDFEGKDKDTIAKIQDLLIKNQENRSQLSLLLRAGVFSHEWFVLLVLFTITLSYIILIDYGNLLLLHIVAALLCTGLALLMLILAKFAALTHKKAKPVWQPLERLLATDFKHIDQSN